MTTLSSDTSRFDLLLNEGFSLKKLTFLFACILVACTFYIRKRQQSNAMQSIPKYSGVKVGVSPRHRHHSSILGATSWRLPSWNQQNYVYLQGGNSRNFFLETFLCFKSKMVRNVCRGAKTNDELIKWHNSLTFLVWNFENHCDRNRWIKNNLFKTVYPPHFC